MKVFGKKIPLTSSKKDKTKSRKETCRCDSLQKELEALNTKHEKEVVQLKDEFNTEKNRLIENHKNEQEKELSQALDQHEKDVQNVQQLHKDELQKLQEEHQRKLNELRQEHEKKLQEKEKEHLENLTKAKTESNGSSPRLKSPVGTPVSPENVPEELKSLHFVLEMKNDEIKNLRTKNMELQRKMDDYYELQNKFDAINQKNQSLSEMLKLKSTNERQLSVERESLMEKFEQESRKVSQLSMEREQLIWRASNPDLSYRSLENLNEEYEGENGDSHHYPLKSSGPISNGSTPRIRMNGEAKISKKLKRRSMNF